MKLQITTKKINNHYFSTILPQEISFTTNVEDGAEDIVRKAIELIKE